ncbi:hypothetical protein B0H14DRAFT_3535116 [Mycena olivaceomarginata]|nr:hypothetical protein B0H14DRAFT_3535116 [Mycena olivaceomarginata]
MPKNLTLAALSQPRNRPPVPPQAPLTCAEKKEKRRTSAETKAEMDAAIGEIQSYINNKAIETGGSWIEGPELHAEFYAEYEAMTPQEKKDLVVRFVTEVKNEVPKIQRDTPMARIRDFSNTVKNIEQLMHGLSYHVGMAGFFCFVQDSTDFHIEPQWYFTSPELERYLPLAVGRKWEQAKVGPQLEAFAIAGCDTMNLLRTARQKAAFIKSKIHDLVGSGLVKITGKQIDMEYVHHEESIILHYGVKLVGWTADKFVNPSDLSSSLGALTTLRNALQNSECKWEKLFMRGMPCKRKHNEVDEGSDTDDTDTDEAPDSTATMPSGPQAAPEAPVRKRCKTNTSVSASAAANGTKAPKKPRAKPNKENEAAKAAKGKGKAAVLAEDLTQRRTAMKSRAVILSDNDGDNDMSVGPPPPLVVMASFTSNVPAASIASDDGRFVLADQELARELLEIEEDHQRRTGYQAAADANFELELELELEASEGQGPEDLKLQHPAPPPSGPSGHSILGAALRQKYEKPALHAAREPKHRTPAREEIVADREDTDFAESNADTHPHTPDLSPSPPPPMLAVRSGGSTHAPPKHMPAVKSDMRRTTPTIVPSSPAVKSLKSSTSTWTPATRPEATPKTEAPTPKIKIKTEAPVPDIKVEAPTPALKTGPRTRPAHRQLQHTGPRTRPLIASSNVHEHDTRAEVPTPAIKARSHTRPLIVSSKAHEPDMGEPRAECTSTQMHLAKSEGWRHTQREFGQAATHVHVLHINRLAPLLESDEEDLAVGKESALPTCTCASHIERPAPLFENDGKRQGSAPSNHKRTISPETTLPVVMINSDSAPTSPDTSTISRSAGKRQKLVMLPAAHTESAIAPLAAASSSQPLIFVNQSTRATYRSYKVAINVMAVDESMVPMDLEEATKMISAAGDR